MHWATHWRFYRGTESIFSQFSLQAIIIITLTTFTTMIIAAIRSINTKIQDIYHFLQPLKSFLSLIPITIPLSSSYEMVIILLITIFINTANVWAQQSFINLFNRVHCLDPCPWKDHSGSSMGMFSHSNRAQYNTIGRQQNTQIGQLYYNNGQYYSIPATLWITLKSLSHPNKSPYSPTIGLIRIQFAIWCVLNYWVHCTPIFKFPL